jgi:hypothetical protein
MTPSFNKDGKPLAPDALENVSRGVTFTLGLSGFSSIKFFSNHATSCPASEAKEKSAEMYRTAYEEVEQDVRDYKARMQQMTDEVLNPPEPAAAPIKKAEENPFRVSAAPSPAPSAAPVEHPAEQPLTPVASTPVDVKPEIQPGHDPDLEKAKDLLAEVTGRQLATPPPDAAPPRRGRKPKDVPSNPEIKAALKQTPTAEPEPAAQPLNGQFQADDTDLPAAMGGAHESEPGPDLKQRTKDFIQGQETQIPSQPIPPPPPIAAPLVAPVPPGPQLVQHQGPGQLERIQAVEATLAATGRDPGKVHDAVKEFFRAFLNIKGPLPKPPSEDYKFAVPILESLATRGDAWLARILTTSAELGLEAGAGWGKFVRHIDKWQEPIKKAAMRVALWKYPDNAMDLLDFLHNTAKLGALDLELLTFLRVFRTVGAAPAMALRECSLERGRNMAEIVDGLDLELITEGELLSRISGGSKIQAGQTAELWDEGAR